MTEHYLLKRFPFFSLLLYLSAANAPASDRKDLLSELELMKKLKPHPHVIKLMGCVTESGIVSVFEKLSSYLLALLKTQIYEEKRETW